MQERALVEAAEEAVRTSQEVRDTYIDSNRGVIMHTVNRVLDTLGSIGFHRGRSGSNSRRGCRSGYCTAV
jgi:hypothetical protein